MAHESFEDPAIAELMNELFVNIKVDREERPDIDKLYQTAHQLITQRGGGWPLTMFLTPDGELPFFGGTYFPNEERHGMPAFPELLQKVAHYFQQNPAEARKQGQALADIFPDLETPAPDEGTKLDGTPIQTARAELDTQFDQINGGFGGAPKFPQAASIERLLQHWRASASSEEPDVQALFMAALSLNRMADGGLNDHIGGGFYRYSVDASWQIPHFEKMLYDNGPLLALYAELYSASGDEYLADVANATANWLLREMRSPEGAFYASLDADTSDGEGSFYAWTPESVKEILDAETYPIFAQRFGLNGPANFEDKWHLSVRESLKDLADSSGQSELRIKTVLAAARTELFNAREPRERPGRDDKILCSWNALTIRALAISARALERKDLQQASIEALRFIRETMLENGRLFASYKDGQRQHQAYLDDYAFCLDAALQVLSLHYDPAVLQFAVQLADCLLEHFQDSERGGFFYTADDHEKLLHRARPFSDDAMPAGNAIAVRGLTRLGFLLGESRYLKAAESTLLAAWRAMTDYAQGHVSMISALDEYLQGTEIVIIRADELTGQQWANAAAHLYAPRRLIIPIASDQQNLPAAIAEKISVNGKPTAYICRGPQCSLPVTSFDALASALSDSSAND